MAKEVRSHRSDEPRPADAEALRQLVVDAAAEKFARKAEAQTAKVRAKAAKHVAALERLAAHLDAVDVWIGGGWGRRRGRRGRCRG